MKGFYLIFITILFCLTAEGQVFIRQGRITYERKVNQWANISGDFEDQFRESVPEYSTDIFTLTFDDSKSLYQPGSEIKKNFFYAQGVDNVVYSDFTGHEYIAMKDIFEKTFLVIDSTSKIKWKIKDDFREIAGFNCRRATAMVFDSVFIVAFYTDQITLPGGPESFNGLPGTILGLIINRLHTTWYATKVEAGNVNLKEITPPRKGVLVNRKEVIQQLQQKSSGNSVQEIQRLLWMALI